LDDRSLTDEADRARTDLSSLRTAVHAAAPCPAILADVLRES
jgi:hypothetical protein